jgi:hypothetical protein
MSLGWSTIIWPIAWFVSPWLFFWSAWFVGMPKRELTRPIPSNEMKWVVFGTIVFLVLMIGGIFFFPHSHSDAVNKFARRPLIIIPLWLITLVLGYLAWKRKRRNSVS